MVVTVNDSSVELARGVQRICKVLAFDCTYNYDSKERKATIEIDCEPEHEDMVWAIVNRAKFTHE